MGELLVFRMFKLRLLNSLNLLDRHGERVVIGASQFEISEIFVKPNTQAFHR